MPFYDDSVASGLANAPLEPLPVTVPSAPFSKLFDSAMRRENLVGSITESATQPPMGAFDPTFDPWANIKGYEDYARSFVGANNADDVLHIKTRIDKEKRDDELLSNGGWRGALALLAAGTLDPVNLIPLGQVRAVSRTGRALEGVLRGGAAMGAGTVLQEIGLQGTQITRPASESLLNIGSGTVLGGVLGGAVGALTRPTAQTLRHLGDSSAIGGMIFDRELAANLPGRRNLEEAAEVFDTPAIQRATAAANGDVAKVTEDLRLRVEQELSTGGIVEHRNQGGEKVRINSIDEAGVLTDTNGARLTLDDVTGPGHSLEIRAPVAVGRAFGAAVEDPLALNLRGELSAARAAGIRDTLAELDPTEVARLREAGVPVDPEMWKVLATNLEKAEASREGGIEVVIDQAQYLRPGGDLDTISEREAFAAINRAMQAEVARGGDPARFLDDAIAAGLGADARLPGWVQDWKSRLLYAMPTPEVQARGALVEQLAGVRGPIVDEVSRVLTASGRPEREARLYGQLAQVRYATRAARRELGESAEELFRRDFPGVARGEAGELRAGELAQAPNETKGHPEGDAEDAAWRGLEPEKTAGGKYIGAPEGVTNGRQLGQLRRLIMQLINEGAPGRFWYEDSARRIAQITRGNLPESEKLIGLVAIYSPQTAVFTNMGFAIKAFEQWKRGEPINVKTGSQDARAQAWLDRGEDWGGRKTNSFYLNLMHDIITEHPEALPQLNLPPDVLTEIRRATVDLWVLRALGYRVDAAGGEMAGGRTKYAFSEREIQRAAGMLNKDLAPGERRWLPHQVQAALWSAIKARYEIPEIKRETIAESMRRGFSRMVRGEDGVERWSAPDKNGPEKQGHMEIWRRRALKAPAEEVARMVETARGSFGDTIDRIAQNVTGEAVPSASLGHAINNASPEARVQFTRDALRLLIDDDGNDTLAAQLGVNLNFNHLGAGLFEGNINPTVVTTLVPEKPAGFFDAAKARQYARAWQYIFRQDAVPIFRADVAAGPGDYFVLNAAGKARRNFPTQEAAQAYADRFNARGEARTVHGDKLALGIKLIFSQDLDDPALQRIAEALMEELGPNVGFTKTGDRDVAFINYRGGDASLPDISDARFADAIAKIRDREELGVSDSVQFGSEGEYGPIHDWSADPSGRALQEGIPGRPDLQSWVDDRAAAFRSLLDDWADPDTRLAAASAERDRVATGERIEPGAAAGDGGAEGGAAGGRSLRQAQRISEEAAAGYPKLRGLPDAPMEVGGNFYVPGPFAKAKEAALNYMRRAGLTYAPPRDYVPVDRVRASRIAELFEQMEHAPDDPRVRASYEALAKETLDQWQAIKETGLVVEWIKPGQVDPYAGNPRLAIMDVIDNNHWWGFPTDLGYGTADVTARAGNPMLQLTDEVVDGRRLLVNDVFRIVHDYFGHIAEGVGFRASGEENAWRHHSAMYSELARGAMTSETRGQNSWVNFGPHGEVNRTANAADTIYSPQKVGLLPEWVWNEGRLDAPAGELAQAGRGKIRLSTESERALITLFRDADASTFGHEIAHHWLTELFTDAALPKAPAALRKHADDVRAWLGLEEGAPIDVAAQEKFATGFEQYLREGRAPTPELANAFRQFRDWLVKIYQTITGLGEPISPEVRALYDRFLTVEERDGVSAAGGSLSAASPHASIDQETIASALGIEKALVRVSPTLRTGTSPSVETRRISMALADQPLDLKKNVEGIPTAQSAESLIKQFQGPLAEAEVGVDDLFTQYRLGRSRRAFDIARLEARDMFGAPEGAMSYSEFRQAVGRAMRRGDEAIEPEVAEAAKLLRRKVFDPLKQRAIDAGLMPDDIDTKTAESYLMRVYDSNKIVAQRGQFSDVITRWLASEQAKKDTIRTRVTSLLGEYELLQSRAVPRVTRIAEIRDELEELVTSWEGKTSQAAKKALARRAEEEATRTPEQGRLAAADKPVIDAAEAIANTNTRLEEGELRDIARQIIDRILGSPVGRLPYDVEVPHPSGGPPRPDRAAPRGPLAQRSFMIPDELIEPWLESDSREIARMYTRTMAPDVVLAERFGRTDMEAQLQQIQEAYERLRQGRSEAEQTRLHNQMQADLRDIAAMRDRLRGTYALPADPNGLGNRAFHVVRDLNYLRLLGGMTISAIPDMGRLVMQHGFGRVFSDAIVPMLSGFREFRLAADEVKLAGTALDMVLDTRAMSMADMLDDYGRWTKYERGLKGLTDRFGIVSLMAPWNSAMKQIAGVIGQTRTLEAIEALVAGQPMRGAERTRLASLGIGPDMAERIDAQFKAHGEKQDNGTWWANSQAWTDRDAIEAFRSALNKEIDTTIVTKGQEVPLWMSGGGSLLPGNVGKMIGQFRSFGLASAQRVMMAGLQKRDMATLNGALMMVGLGMMVYAARYYANPKAQPLPDPTTPGGLARWIREGVDISGLTGYLFDIHNMVEKASGGGIGISRLTGGPAQSRYANRNTLESILGPTAGLVQDAGQLLGAATKGEWSAGDSSRVRRMIPFQNLIGLRHLFDAAEHGVNSAFGVREPPPRTGAQR